MTVRSSMALAAIAVLFVGSRAGAQARPRLFSGVWYMDTTKFVKHDPVLQALQLDIRQEGDSVNLVTDVTDQRKPNGPLTRTSTAAHYRLDGQARQNRMGNGDLATTVASWQRDTLVFKSSTIAAVDSQPLTITTRWVLDAAGTTLTQIQRMQHGKRDLTQTLLFTKR